MSELISGKEALIALANGYEVEYKTTYNPNSEWHEAKLLTVNTILNFDNECITFRLRTRTITINGIEVPAPDHIEKNPNLYGGWAINIGSEYYMYKSESNYNIVVAALRSIFGKK